MLSNEDIKKITEAQIEAQKEVFYTKEDLDKKFSRLQTSVDSFAKDKKYKDEEIPVLDRRIKKVVENWIDKAAPKLGIKFNH